MSRTTPADDTPPPPYTESAGPPTDGHVPAGDAPPTPASAPATNPDPDRLLPGAVPSSGRCVSALLGLVTMSLAIAAWRLFERARWTALAMVPGVYCLAVDGFCASLARPAHVGHGNYARDSGVVDVVAAVGISIAAAFAGAIIIDKGGLVSPGVDGRLRGVGVPIVVFLSLLAILHWAFVGYRVRDKVQRREETQRMGGGRRKNDVRLGHV